MCREMEENEGMGVQRVGWERMREVDIERCVRIWEVLRGGEGDI